MHLHLKITNSCDTNHILSSASKCMPSLSSSVYPHLAMYGRKTIWNNTWTWPLLYLTVAEVPLFAAHDIPFWKQTFMSSWRIWLCVHSSGGLKFDLCGEKERTGLVTTPGSEFLKGVKADSLFLEEYFLSKQNVKHPYLISLVFRSTQSNILN